MTSYSEEDLKKIQSIALEMAQYFVDFCNENDLLCYFCGGGCIGALRHKGFIPWDDDLDFFMPRSDYEKLLNLWKKKANTEKYTLNKQSFDFIDHNLFITIKDNQTTMIRPYQKELDIAHGLALDILPLDGYPKSPFKRKTQKIYALIYSLFCSQVVPEKHGGIMTYGSKILLTLISSKKLRYRIWKFCEKRMSRFNINECDYITELCSGPGYMQKKYPSKAFKSAIMVPFENTSMPIPIGYDDYLREAFGDYMVLPPKEKRFAHHDCVFLDLENGYEKYKGIYYLKYSKKEKETLE